MIDVQGKIQRRDHELRAAIDRLKQNSMLHFDAKQLLVEMLREVGDLTQSSFTTVLKQSLMDNEQPRHICVAAQKQSSDGQWTGLEVNGLLHLEQSSKPFFDVLLQCRALVLGRPSLRSLNKFNSHWPNIERAMLIPLSVDKNNQYLICICNSDKSYQTKEMQRLWPLIIHVSTQLKLVVSHTNKPVVQSKNDESTDNPIAQEDNVWRKIFYRLERINPLAMITLNSDRLICRVNEATENLLSINGSELLQKPIDNYLLNHAIILQSLKNTSATNVASRIRKGMGDILDIQLNLVHYEEQGLQYDLLLIEKVESRSVNQNAVALALERFQVLASMLPMGILQTDADWQTEYVNQRWLEIIDCNVGDVYGLDWMQLFHPEEAEDLLIQLHESITAGHEFIRECQMKFQQTYKWVMLHATPIVDHKGEGKGLIATVSDFTKQHEAEQQLRDMAEKDPLTGLSNRASFFDRLDHALQRVERHGSLALLALDLDGFKHINDTLGHDVGDFILTEVANRLRNSVRREDTVCRVGGDEFLIIIEGLEDASIVAYLAEKILNTLREPCQLGSKEIFISTSIGISFSVSGRNTNSKNLLKQADLALYRAKDSGRNNYQYYSPELEQVSRKKLELTNDLHRALARQEFEVFYQAQLDIDSNKIRGFEALLRWNHPTNGLISPTEFIPLLEESGLISTVSLWMCQQSFNQLREWIIGGLLDENAVVSVNISPRQFYDEHLVKQLHDAIINANLSCANVVVEITETLLLKEHNLTISHLNHLHKLGIKIALDDFGTGFSSLSYLKKFPIDIIKIDRSFIKDITTDENDSLITKAVIRLGESLGLTVLAEGVDTSQILALLKSWHCAKYQGFLINQPLPANKVKALCNQHSNLINELQNN
ncbi:sensor domain-containing protein [Paraglaciecola arctica]|uniref:sensor domain-containing protein n=1 Tax=Paraglaciecola arctica TaxID=1128911 RepID=UPI001C06C2B9|nr:bifunctional diguanylate cyclase/phosphodiesterase [Paraglaciecola arctica]MBU3004600.1 EAL domain-containing protein [Paraglaciecola arctica]